MEGNILEIRNLSKSFSKSNNRFGVDNYSLLSNLDVLIPRGKVSALIGGNGTGKTTLFNIISGFVKEDVGDIFFYDTRKIRLNDIPTFKREQLGIGRMFQDNHVFPSLSVCENLIIADDNNLRESPIEAIFRRNKIRHIEEFLSRKAYDNVLKHFGESSELVKKFNCKASTLSYGQRKLVGLMRLLMSDSKLILLDEPTAGINPNLYKTIEAFIKKMVSENDKTVFLIEHNMDFVSRTAEHCMYLDNGNIVMQGDPNHVLEDENVQKSYLGA